MSRMGLQHTVDLVMSICLGPCHGFFDLQGRSIEAMPPIDVSTLDLQDPLSGQGSKVVNNIMRDRVMSDDLTRPWPMDRRLY